MKLSTFQLVLCGCGRRVGIMLSYLCRRMYLKDYYKTLELEPSATLQEIKKAYRKLAQQYHPDKNNDDPHSIAYFNEIKEAYETLTNPAKKDNYLQQRWYNKASANTNTQELITPVSILKRALEFEKYTAALDVFRIDRESLFDYMNKLLSEETINKLLQFDEPDINQQIMLTLLKPIRFLKYEKAVLLTDKLSKLIVDKNQNHSLISSTLQQIKQKEKWQQYKWIVIVLITAALCILIKFASV